MALYDFHRGRVLRIALGITMLALLLAGGAGAATITVDDSGGADYTRIQDAVNAASDGDTIVVEPGTYYESVTVDKRLNLKGIDIGNGKPVVSSVGGSAITLLAGWSTIDGFGVTKGGGDGYHGGIYVNSANNIISNNSVYNNGAGIWTDYAGNNSIVMNEVFDNGQGINVLNSGHNTLIGNVVNNNSWRGIYTTSSYSNILIDNIVSNSREGIHMDFGANNTLRNNIMTNNSNNFGISALSYGDYRDLNDIDMSNLLDGKPIYYLIGASGITIDSLSNAGAVYCINCDNINIRDLTLSNNEVSIYFRNSTNSHIYNNNITN